MGFAASRIEYRFRFMLHGLIYGLCFAVPRVFQLGTQKTAWIYLATLVSERGWLAFLAAANVLLVVAIVFAALGAFYRVWGTAYVGESIVRSRDMHGDAMLADGPYRRTRNPLYLGTLLHTVGLSLIMPAAGAVVCIALIWILQIRLALAEEPFLAAKFGAPYLGYKQRVPRFLPAMSPLVPAAGQKPAWVQAVLGEIYFVGVAIVLATVGWQFNAQPLILGVVISLGVWLVVRMLMARKWAEAAVMVMVEALGFVGWWKDSQPANKGALVMLGVLLIVMGLRRPQGQRVANGE